MDFIVIGGWCWHACDGSWFVLKVDMFQVWKGKYRWGPARRSWSRGGSLCRGRLPRPPPSCPPPSSSRRPRDPPHRDWTYLSLRPAATVQVGALHFFSIECVIVLCPVLKLGPPSNINNETEGPNSSHNGRGTRDPDHRFLNIIEIAGCHRPSPILSWPKS